MSRLNPTVRRQGTMDGPTEVFELLY